MPVKFILIVRAGKDVMQRSFISSEALPTTLKAVQALLQANDLRLETMPFDFVVSSISGKYTSATRLQDDAHTKDFFAQVNPQDGEVTFDITLNAAHPDTSQNLTSKFMDDDIVTLLIFPPLTGTNISPASSPAAPRDGKKTPAESVPETSTTSVVIPDVVEKTFIIPLTGVLNALRRAVADTLRNDNALIDYAPRISLFHIEDRASPPTPLRDDRAARQLLQEHAKAGSSAKITYTVAAVSTASQSTGSRRSSCAAPTPRNQRATPPLSVPSASNPAKVASAPPVVEVPSSLPPVSQPSPSCGGPKATANIRLRASEDGDAEEVAFTFAYEKKETKLLERFRTACGQQRKAFPRLTSDRSDVGAVATDVVVVVGGARHVIGNDGELREWMALAKESGQPLRIVLRAASSVPTKLVSTASPSDVSPSAATTTGGVGLATADAPAVTSPMKPANTSPTPAPCAPVVKTEVTTTTVPKKNPLPPLPTASSKEAAASTQNPSPATASSSSQAASSPTPKTGAVPSLPSIKSVAATPPPSATGAPASSLPVRTETGRRSTFNVPQRRVTPPSGSPSSERTTAKNSPATPAVPSSVKPSASAPVKASPAPKKSASPIREPLDTEALAEPKGSRPLAAPSLPEVRACRPNERSARVSIADADLSLRADKSLSSPSQGISAAPTGHMLQEPVDGFMAAAGASLTGANHSVANSSVVMSATEVQLPKVKGRSHRASLTTSSRATTPRGTNGTTNALPSPTATADAARRVSAAAAVSPAAPPSPSAKSGVEAASAEGGVTVTTTNSVAHTSSNEGTSNESVVVKTPPTDKALHRRERAPSTPPHAPTAATQTPERPPPSVSDATNVRAADLNSPPSVQTTLGPNNEDKLDGTVAYHSPRSPRTRFTISSGPRASVNPASSEAKGSVATAAFQCFVRVHLLSPHETREGLVCFRVSGNEEGALDDLGDAVLRTYGLEAPAGVKASTVQRFAFCDVSGDGGGIVTRDVETGAQLAGYLADAALSSCLLEIHITDDRVCHTSHAPQRAAVAVPINPVDSFADALYAALHASDAKAQGGKNVTTVAVEAILSGKPSAAEGGPLQSASSASVSRESLRGVLKDRLRTNPHVTMDHLVDAVLDGRLRMSPWYSACVGASEMALSEQETALHAAMERCLEGVSAQEVETYVRTTAASVAADAQVAPHQALCSVVGALLSPSACPSYLRWLADHFRGKLSGILFAKMRAYQGAASRDAGLPIDVLYSCCWELTRLTAMDWPGSDKRKAQPVFTVGEPLLRWCLAAVQLECLHRRVHFPPLPPHNGVPQAPEPVCAGALAVASAVLDLARKNSTRRQPSIGDDSSTSAQTSSAGGGSPRSGERPPVPEQQSTSPRRQSSPAQPQGKRNSKVQYRYRYQCPPSAPTSAPAGDATTGTGENAAADRQAM